jgi:hypothetical protein
MRCCCSTISSARSSACSLHARVCRRVVARVLAALQADDVHFAVESRSAEHVAALVASCKADLGFAL